MVYRLRELFYVARECCDPLPTTCQPTSYIFPTPGYMMEMATWDRGVSRTIQFVIPPGITEEIFDRLRSNLPEVFRTTSTRDLTR